MERFIYCPKISCRWFTFFDWSSKACYFFTSDLQFSVFIVGEMALHAHCTQCAYRGWGGYDLRAGGGDWASHRSIWAPAYDRFLSCKTIWKLHIRTTSVRHWLSLISRLLTLSTPLLTSGQPMQRASVTTPGAVGVESVTRHPLKRSQKSPTNTSYFLYFGLQPPVKSDILCIANAQTQRIKRLQNLQCHHWCF